MTQVNKYFNHENIWVLNGAKPHTASGNNASLYVRPSDDVETIKDIHNIPLINIEFSDFEDGRPYSQIHLLCNKLKYQGEIRAVNAHLDQLQCIARLGVHSFTLAEDYHTEDITKYLTDISVCYQQAENNFGLAQRFI